MQYHWDGKKLNDWYPIALFAKHNINWHYSNVYNLVIETGGGDILVCPGDSIVMGDDGIVKEWIDECDV